ncbi:MAG: alpha/beta hydrolase [Bacteroidota bacterium]
MEPVAHNLVVQRTARYFTLGNPDSQITDILIVLHGYGMFAGAFLADFRPLTQPGMLIVAPEGLSRFYRKGFDGEVVSSWMTREDRLAEIADQRFFLDRLYDQLNARHSCRTHVLGFSQGTATATRWMAGNERTFSNLILWGGDFAPDVDGKVKGVSKIHCVVGSTDPFIPLPLFEERCVMLENKGYQLERHVFDGGHVIPADILTEVWKKSNAHF